MPNLEMKESNTLLPPIGSSGAGMDTDVPGVVIPLPASGKPLRSRRRLPEVELPDPSDPVVDSAPADGGARYLVDDPDSTSGSKEGKDEDEGGGVHGAKHGHIDVQDIDHIDQEDIDALVSEHPHLTEQEILQLAKMFNMWDDDGSGEISVDEMGEMLDRLTKELFFSIDKDGDGLLDKHEVMALGKQLGQALSKKELEEAMEAMDGDGDGEINFEEFDAWWRTWKGYASREELEDLFAEVDADGSGEIDMMEFINMIGYKVEGKHTPGGDSDPMQMVRMALEGVRDDVRAIYGASTRPKSSWQMAREMETAYKQRRCFVTTDSGTKSDNFRKMWDLIQAVLLIYVAMAVPYRIGFGKDVEVAGGWFWFEVFVDAYFVTDICINFRTGFRDVEGEMVIESKEVARAYLKNWFFIDVMACMPVTYIGLFLSALHDDDDGGGGDGGAAQLKALKILRLLRLAKMLRLAKLKMVIKRLDEDFPGLFTFTKLSSLIVIILYISHLFASFWYFVGSFDQHHQDGEIVQGWSNSLRPTITTASRYIDAYYYAITTLTTVGYGDKVPKTDPEKLFAMVTELAGGIIFGILAGTLSAMLTEGNAAAMKAEDEMDQLKEFMMNKKIDKGLRREIMENMTQLSKADKGNESEILERLPPKHRKTLLLSMYRPLLISCPLFHGLEDTIITKVAMNMSPYIGVKGDTIVQENDVGNQMYMVLHGEVQLSSVACEKFNGRCWVDGAFFGELPLLGLGLGDVRNRHVYNVVAHVDCDLIYLQRSQLRELESDYPIFKSQVRQLAAKRAERFGLKLDRVTLQVDHVQRRMSIALDAGSLAACDPDMAKAFGLLPTSTAPKKSPVAPKRKPATKAVSLRSPPERPVGASGPPGGRSSEVGGGESMTNAEAMAAASALHEVTSQQASGGESPAGPPISNAAMIKSSMDVNMMEQFNERFRAIESKIESVPRIESELKELSSLIRALCK